MLDAQTFDKVARQTLNRILTAIDDAVDPDLVEAVPSDGVVRLDFQGQRRDWVVNSQSAALQIWLAAEQRAWHFAHVGDDPEQQRWVADKTGDELFATLSGLLKQHVGVEVTF